MLGWGRAKQEETIAALHANALARLEAALDEAEQTAKYAPIALLNCDADLRIRGTNDAADAILRSLEHQLGSSLSRLEHTTLDLLLKLTRDQREQLLTCGDDPVYCSVGQERLELRAAERFTKADLQPGFTISLAVRTVERQHEEELALYAHSLDALPQNLLFCHVNDLKIRFANKASLETVGHLEHALKITPETLIGSPLDVFDRELSHLHAFLSDPKNLPHQKICTIGEHSLEFIINAQRNTAGELINLVVTWARVTEQYRILERVKQIGGELGNAATAVSWTAGEMSSSAEKTSFQASAVAAASEEASVNVATVASATKQLSGSINEISDQVDQLAGVARQAASEAENADKTMQTLHAAAQEINDVVKIIGDISSQIKLLALNATIEAARAGSAGRGFGVVASEVTNMVDQTSKATQRIADQIHAIQRATQAAVQAIQSIVKTVDRVSEASNAIATAVEEQNSATAEISRNVEEAAIGTRDVSANISGVTQTASENARTAGTMLDAAGSLSQQAEDLRRLSKQIEQILGGNRPGER